MQDADPVADTACQRKVMTANFLTFLQLRLCTKLKYLFRANLQNATHFIPVFEILLGSEQLQIK